jgi:hypothetical protein
MFLLNILFTATTFLNQNPSSEIVGHIAPLPNELLSQPIILNDCPGVKIIEWTGSPNKPNTTPNEKTIDVLNKVCKQSQKMFVNFVSSYNLKVDTSLEFRYTVSILPWNAFDAAGKVWGPGDGDDYRALQDTKWRFNTRFQANDPIKEYLGWTERSLHHLFVLNDVLDHEKNHDSFIDVFAHELFHAMSEYYGLYSSLSENVSIRQNIDEKLADKFGKLVYTTIKDLS